MRDALRYLIFAMSMSCMGNPTKEELPMTNGEAESVGLRPSWHVGDAWSVRYRIMIPSTRGTADGPPEWEEHPWSFRVNEESDDGSFEVVATSPMNGNEPWLLRFNPTGQLRSIDPPGDDSLEFVGSGPRLPLVVNWGSKLIADWPAFPLPAVGKEKVYRDDIRQHTEREGDRWKAIVERTGDFHGAQLTKILEQTWEPGRPWWTTMSIRTRLEDGSPGLEAHGELLPPTKDR